jgi:hypothetical protein
MEQGFLLEAFQRDFRTNGPSLARLIRTLLNGWQQYKRHREPRIRARYLKEVNPLRTTYAGAVWAMKWYYRNERRMFRKMSRLLSDIYREFGWKTRMFAPLAGIYAYFCMNREQRRLARGWQYEPVEFYEKNRAASRIESVKDASGRTPSRPVTTPIAVSALSARR